MHYDSLKSSILYQDDLIIVINKPASMPVHSGTGGGENLEQYLGELCFGLPDKPIPAHRLDRDTSGCLILGRNKEGLRRIGKIFMARRITKTYLAVVHGSFDKIEGRIDINLRKQSPLKHRWWMEAHPEGQPSVTDYRVINQKENLAAVEFYPRTGRTHQIRVHCKAIGHPIVGDKIYGFEQDPENLTMHLHALAITIPLYHNQSPIEISAPPPAHMLGKLQECGYCEHA